MSWVLTGEGNMINSGYVQKSILQAALPDEILNTSDMNCPHCKYKDELIEELRNRLNDKERLIIEKDQVINLLLKTPGTINKSAI
jgi:DNA-directed RNA polymerase subunit M/transcription elongation factor TFIIS